MSIAMRFLLSFIVWVALSEVHAGVIPEAEAQKIDSLIRAVEQLSNAKFLRNGAAYDAPAAAAHLRRKLRAARERIQTAADFIRLCGSQSSVSGKPYQIQFGDGTLVTGEEFLRAQLRALEGRNP
jgi:hypothetical protein